MPERYLHCIEAERVGFRKGMPVRMNAYPIIIVGDQVTCLEEKCPLANCSKVAFIQSVYRKGNRGFLSERQGDAIVKPVFNDNNNSSV